MIDLTNKSIAVVGNSAGLFDHKYGPEIDTHEVVIRINRAANIISKNSSTYWTHGTKFDLWAVWRIDEYENLTIDIDKYLDRTIQFAWWHGSTREVQMAPKTLVKSLAARMNTPNPSTGIMTLDWVSVHNPAVVNVYGFDWKKTPTWTDPKREADKGCIHDWEVEREYCDNYFRKELKFNFK